MEMLSKIILVISVFWLLWQLMQFRRCVVNGFIIVPLSVSATGIFGLGVVGVLVTGISPFHLIWMFLVSYLVGTVLLVFPWYQILLMNGLSLLALTSRQSDWETTEDEVEDEYIDIPIKTRPKKRKHSSPKHKKHTKRKKRRRGR
jgi:hypothetical protein